ncbi:hypothetical protein PSHT_02957 [Puccinia striiformis]|uniref:Uncharacterized protein n=1 Tax=Puccinia striiformis TaxID=27350 RepID=A0A2S4WGP2_9BASI|nr:hypothetical protein PSHT_02957 [Puccinia striiformis]
MKRATKTLKFTELHAWRQDNPYILTGYRPNLPSMVACLKSIFAYFHNETVNIHTHLWGSVTFCLLIFSLSKPSQYIPWGIRSDMDSSNLSSSVTWKDTFVFGAFSSQGCPASDLVCSTFGRLDYIGIVWLIVGSFYPSVYYGFFCRGKVIAAYLILITTLGAFATYTVVSPAYRSNSGRRNRTIVFVALGLSGIFPVTHGILSHGLLDAADRVGLWWLLGSGAMYIIGAIFYAERFPERLTPGSFDLIGSSHQV